MISAALLGAGITAAHAEMTDPPIQAEIDSSGGGFVSTYSTPAGGPVFNQIGTVPPGYGGSWSVANQYAGEFSYFPNSGRAVNLNDLAAFNAWKAGGCYMIGSAGIACTY